MWEFKRNLHFTEKKELELLNGERLTVSRARAKGFLEAFAVEISKKYEEDR